LSLVAQRTTQYASLLGTSGALHLAFLNSLKWTLYQPPIKKATQTHKKVHKIKFMTTLCVSVANRSCRSCAASDSSVIAAPGVREVVVENASEPVLEDNLHIRVPAENEGVPFLHHFARAPVRVAEVDDLVSHFQIDASCLFHLGASSGCDRVVTFCTSRNPLREGSPETP
jgi:hypothetical protein